MIYQYTVNSGKRHNIESNAMLSAIKPDLKRVIQQAAKQYDNAEGFRGSAVFTLYEKHSMTALAKSVVLREVSYNYTTPEGVVYAS